MAEKTPNISKEADAWLTEVWSARFAEVLETMCGERPQIKPPESAAAADTGEETIWWEQSLDLDGQPTVSVGAPGGTWNALGKRALSAAGIDDATPEDIRGTYQELIQQGLGGLAQSIGAKAGQEVTCGEGRDLTAAPAGPLMRLRIAYSDEDTWPLYVSFGPRLRSVLFHDKPSGEAKAEAPAESEGASAPASPTVAPSGEGYSSKTIDLLLDVELPVSVSFGRTYLPLKDVLKLSSGSIVELNRSVSEPVEVIVNNCVIARGDVVVVDGNYGVRVAQIISRQERLRTLN